MNGRSSASSVHPMLWSSTSSTAAVTDRASDSTCPPAGGAFVLNENSVVPSGKSGSNVD